MNAFIEGFFLQAGLIFALGAQNLFVLESGLRRRKHLLVALICSLCDTFLISLGVLGVGILFSRFPFLKVGFGILGVAFLAYYGFRKLVEKPEITRDDSNASDLVSLSAVIAYTLAFSLLNPHVYLDTFILIGGYASKFPTNMERGQFGIGAASFSTLWFFGLATLSAALSKFMSNPRTLKKVYLVSGCVLLILAFKLGTEVLTWHRQITQS